MLVFRHGSGKPVVLVNSPRTVTAGDRIADVTIIKLAAGQAMEDVAFKQ